MKILLIDSEPHEELRLSLSTSGIKLVYDGEMSPSPDMAAFDLIILCPKDENHLKRMMGSIGRSRQVVVLYEYPSDRFINCCAGLGCIDVVLKPYRPEMLAERLRSLIESKIAEEETAYMDNEKLFMDTERFIKREIKKANRIKEPLCIIAVKIKKRDIFPDETEEIILKIRQCIRETDFAGFYKGHIIILLPGCGAGELKKVEQKLTKLSGEDISLLGIVKDKFYDKADFDELEEIILQLKKELD